MWHASYTVGPHVYHLTLLPSSGTNSSFSPVSELFTRSPGATGAAVAVDGTGWNHVGWPFLSNGTPNWQTSFGRSRPGIILEDMVVEPRSLDAHVRSFQMLKIVRRGDE